MFKWIVLKVFDNKVLLYLYKQRDPIRVPRIKDYKLNEYVGREQNQHSFVF